MAEPPPERDAMEPPGVSTGLVLMAVLGVFALLAVSVVVLGAFYLHVTGGPVRATARPLPSPQLETSQTPAATVGQSHGPAPLRAPPVPQRAGEIAPAPPGLAAAMAAEAARGAAAYGPAASTGAAPGNASS